MASAPSNGSLQARLPRAAFAFRGYNVTNRGRTHELLAHPAYGPIVEAHLREASLICAEFVQQPVDLVARMRAGRESAGLDDYVEDIALIVAAEMAQLQLLEEFFGIAFRQARLALGYSVGEATALVAAGVYTMTDVLRVLLPMAKESADLAKDTTMAVLFTRGPSLDFELIHRLCLEVSQQGQGVIGVSTYLAPNSVLVLGQHDSLARFETRLKEVFPGPFYLRRNPHLWPPLHTPIIWQRCIPNRTAVLLQKTPGGFRAPSVSILSMVTGEASYREYNSRELIHRWVDHPQRLWDVLCKVLINRIETMVHVGPDPNLVLATFRRLSNNVEAQMNRGGFVSFGRRTLARLVRRPWLTRLLPSSTALFRAPLVQHIVLEDWLLEHEPTRLLTR